MAFLKKQLIEDKNTGFSDKADWVGGRFYNKDGSPNIKKTGIPFWKGISWYNSLLKMNNTTFVLSIFFIFIAINIIFACIYFLIGVHNINGIEAPTELGKITKVFFFSVQTFTTVGYGHISPAGFSASTVSAIEAFTGLLFFALASGLFYGRFSKPRAFLKFSDNAIIAPFQEAKALMFRLVPFKNHQLTEAEVKLSLAMQQKRPDGSTKNSFYNLTTELSKVNALNLSWTVVHPIDENSPLYNFKETDFIESKVEILVFLKAYDEDYSNTVVARSSYLYNEIIYGAKFLPMYRKDTDSNRTIVEVDKLNDMQRVTFS